jgi:hypothetical protein
LTAIVQILPKIVQKAPVTNEQVSSKKITETGKSKNPDYRQTTIYVNKDIQRKLIRLLEDQGYKGDFSDWVEECMLLEIRKHQKY